MIGQIQAESSHVKEVHLYSTKHHSRHHLKLTRGRAALEGSLRLCASVKREIRHLDEVLWQARWQVNSGKVRQCVVNHQSRQFWIW